ncbi:MAG: hypothetical protein IAE92_09440 [Burkholderiaceae bacterium]|nr:hypothetical protein [Burkholderiaceae bacterium]
MLSSVRVVIDPLTDFRFDLDEVQPMPHEAARVWLDEQFTALDCEPLRASGKVLTADKVLVVAQAAGARLLGDAAWGGEFARAASAALAKPVVTVDLSTMSISF